MSRRRPSQAIQRHRAEVNGRRLGEALGEWARYTRREPCYMCMDVPPTLLEREAFSFDIDNRQAHHVLPQQELKRLARRWKWDLVKVLADSRNGMCLCEFHHRRHTQHYVDIEGRSWRVPRRLIRDETYDFATELDVMWLLDREYPPE